jgi:hypothetical protein
MQGTENAPIEGISSYSYKALEMPLSGPFLATNAKHKRSTCRGYSELYIQANGNVSLGGISSCIRMALDMPLYKAFRLKFITYSKGHYRGLLK